jgi:hypothetical protein
MANALRIPIVTSLIHSDRSPSRRAFPQGAILPPLHWPPRGSSRHALTHHPLGVDFTDDVVAGITLPQTIIFNLDALQIKPLASDTTKAPSRSGRLVDTELFAN